MLTTMKIRESSMLSWEYLSVTILASDWLPWESVSSRVEFLMVRVDPSLTRIPLPLVKVMFFPSITTVSLDSISMSPSTMIGMDVSSAALNSSMSLTVIESSISTYWRPVLVELMVAIASTMVRLLA